MKAMMIIGHPHHILSTTLLIFIHTCQAANNDFDKIVEALSIFKKLNSLDAILEHFGLEALPVAQRYGIVFGICTFTCTMVAVISLLVFGGSFKRIAEQSASGGPTVMDSVQARAARPLILEELLEARDRMDNNHNHNKQKFSKLTRELMNVAQPSSDSHDLAAAKEYETNYKEAYLECQDKPGGSTLSGHPEARVEAYARAYASCGHHSTKSYRRSYSRMYESLACKSHKMFQKLEHHFEERPQDIIGRTVRLEPLEVERHAQELYNITSGNAEGENRAYNPSEVWGFLEFGPFKSFQELAQSPIFQRQDDEAAFAIIEMTTNKLLGAILLSQNNPKYLRVQLDRPITKPTVEGTQEEIEACFLLLDRLFSRGYRRIQISLDSQDALAKKLPGRLGFTLEGLLLKHMIVKDANRDSIVYGLLNSDWTKGARAALFIKLHGAKAQKVDARNIVKCEEEDEKKRVLAINKALEEERESNNAKNK